MKRFFTWAVVAALSLSLLAGCGSKDNGSASSGGAVSGGGSTGTSSSAPGVSGPDVSTPDVSAPDVSVPDVSQPEQPDASQPGTDSKPVLTLSKIDFTLKSAGASWKLTVSGGDADQIQFTSSDESVATVAQDGTVTAVAPGTATITAASGGLTAQCIVRCRWTESAPDGSAGGSTSAAKSVDLAGFYTTIAGKYDMSRLEPVDATVQETFYPELMQVNTDQRLVYMCAMSPAPIGDLVLVEVADAKDVDTVKNLLQARIGYMVGDGTRPGGAWYPEPTDMWENESRVVSNGNYVMLVVCEDCDSIVSDFNALF